VRWGPHKKEKTAGAILFLLIMGKSMYTPLFHHPALLLISITTIKNAIVTHQKNEIANPFLIG